MSTKAPTLLDTTVVAEDAPLGVRLWPVLDERYAVNFTLDAVEVVRDPNGRHVRWVYQSGKTRHFKVGEKVHVMVDPANWPVSTT